MPASISFRQSIRWLPDAASEPTRTVVLTGSRTGVFLDVRFVKDTNQLDWAFAGLRSSDGPNVTVFTHLIDSRTLDVSEIDDRGVNTSLPDGTTLEAGEMVNPATGNMTLYEEVWKDEEHETGLFIREKSGASWQARVGEWQMALGRNTDGVFWAWQAARYEDGWRVVYSTDVAEADMLPEDIDDWVEKSTVEWAGKEWEVLEGSSGI